MCPINPQSVILPSSTVSNFKHSTICQQLHVDCFWNVMAHRQKPNFVFRRNGRVHLSRRRRQFSRLLVAEVCGISGSNAGYTVFRGSVKSTGYPLHSSVSTSLPLPCVTVCHHISTGLYYMQLFREVGTLLNFRTIKYAVRKNELANMTFNENVQICPVVCKDGRTRKCLVARVGMWTHLTFRFRNYFFLILAHSIYKMWMIQEPNTSELWNKLHFEEGKKTESI